MNNSSSGVNGNHGANSGGGNSFFSGLSAEVNAIEMEDLSKNRDSSSNVVSDSFSKNLLIMQVIVNAFMFSGQN